RQRRERFGCREVAVPCEFRGAEAQTGGSVKPMAMNRERSLDVRIKVPQSLRFGRTKDGRAFMVVDPSLLDGSATLNSEALRELFIGDLAALTWVRGAIPTDARLPGSAANFLDLLLE